MADEALLVEVWLAGYGARTREAYAGDLRQWKTWLTERGVALLAAERAHVLLWKAQLEERGLQPGTVARKLSAIAGFYASVVADGALPASPCAHIRRPRVSQESTRAGLDRPEWDRLHAAARAAGPEALLLVRLLGLNGLRVSEACGITVADLGEDRGHRVVAVTGKGGKLASVPLSEATHDLAVRVIDARGLRPADHLLPYDRFSAKREVVRLASAAGIRGKRITPHSLRHTFVTLALEAGVPLHDVQDAARHADPRTTQRYNRRRNQLDRHASYRLSAYLDQEPVAASA